MPLHVVSCDLSFLHQNRTGYTPQVWLHGSLGDPFLTKLTLGRIGDLAPFETSDGDTCSLPLGSSKNRGISIHCQKLKDLFDSASDVSPSGIGLMWYERLV